jgi:hypothetical protein
MRKTSFAILFLIAFSFVSKKAVAQDKFTDWPALGEFHDVIAATFHPAEEGHFDPVRQRSGELLDKADKLFQSAVPVKYDKPEMKDALKELYDHCDDLYSSVKKRGKDEKLQKMITIVHESFHKIVGLCTEPK